MTVREAGRKGGEAVKQKYGHPFYSRIGHEGGQKLMAERGRDFYSQIGSVGGKTAYARHGSEFYAEIGRKGGQAVKLSQGPGYFARIGRMGRRPGSSRRYAARPARRQLTQDQAREIRRMQATGQGLAVLARQFGIAYASIKAIVEGRTYREVA